MNKYSHDRKTFIVREEGGLSNSVSTASSVDSCFSSGPSSQLNTPPPAELIDLGEGILDKYSQLGALSSDERQQYANELSEKMEQAQVQPPTKSEVEALIKTLLPNEQDRMMLDFTDSINSSARRDQIIDFDAMAENTPIELKKAGAAQMPKYCGDDIVGEAIKIAGLGAEFSKGGLEVGTEAIPIYDVTKCLAEQQILQPAQCFPVIVMKDNESQTDRVALIPEDPILSDNEIECVEEIIKSINGQLQTDIIYQLLQIIDTAGLNVPSHLRAALSPPGTNWRLLEQPGPSSRPVPELWTVLEGKNCIKIFRGT